MAVSPNPRLYAIDLAQRRNKIAQKSPSGVEVRCRRLAGHTASKRRDRDLPTVFLRAIP